MPMRDSIYGETKLYKYFLKYFQNGRGVSYRLNLMGKLAIKYFSYMPLPCSSDEWFVTCPFIAVCDRGVLRTLSNL